MSTSPDDEARLSPARRQLLALLKANDRLAARVRDTIRPRPQGSSPPLSFAQQRLWFLAQIAPDSPFYNVHSAVRVHAPLDAALIRDAFNHIAARHEVLRTAFAERDGQPFQLILPKVDIPLKEVDLRALAPALKENAIRHIAQEDARTSFDLRRTPLIRLTLVHVDAADFVFLLNVHHIVADGWSMRVLQEEFRKTYEALAAGRPCPLPALPIQYADFAAWQRNRLASGGLDASMHYWMRQLAALPVLDVPTDFPRPEVQSFNGETLYCTFPQALTTALKRFSAASGATLFMTLFAAFNALLHRYTGQTDIVIGEPIANRNRIELEPLIGFFVNSLVLRTDVSGDPSFLELLERSRRVVLDADAHQDVPFEVVVERLKPERSLGRNPLFQVSLQFFSGADAAGLPLVSRDAIHVEKGTASLDLAFDLIESEDGILARVEYSTDLFRSDTIARMVGHYQNILRSFIERPELRISQVRMLSPEESEAILKQANMPPPRMAPVAGCVPEIIDARARAAPERVAIVASDRSLRYADVQAMSDRVACELIERGVRAETIVGVCMDHEPDLIPIILGIWKAGAAYTPLDPSAPMSRLQLLVEDAKPALVVSAPSHQALVAHLGVPSLCPDWSMQRASFTPPRAELGNLAYVIYTSGSTGTPNGVAVEHLALARQLEWMQSEFPLTTEDRGLFKYSFNFDVSLVEMFWPLMAGASIVVPNADAARDANQLVRIVREQGVTHLDVVPSMLAVMLDSPKFTSCRSVTRVFCGGEVMTPPLLGRLLARMDVEFCNMYGPTEGTITATAWRCVKWAEAERVPIGRPAPHMAALVLDEHLNLQPPLVPGELFLAGDGLARGYLGRAELTRQRFVRSPFSRDPSARLYRTGDRCRLLTDGTIDFLGRCDDQVKIRGYRLELQEVEAALTAAPGVRSGAAAIREDAAGRAQLVAYVIPGTSTPELWPSLGEFFVYDELLYHAMTSDVVRVRAYRHAIESRVARKTVVDVGCGADLVLARMCLDAGAARVYAIEMLEEAHLRAEKLAMELGDSRLQVIHGDSRAIELPERVDVCVSELIGTIGSSEGVIDILSDARRFLKSDGKMIPARCVTRMAAVSLPESIARAPRFTEVAAHYANKVFEARGCRFDIRVCIRNLPTSALISGPAIFEDLSFDANVEREGTQEVELSVTRAARLDGLLLWVDLFVDEKERIDVLTSQTSWLPVFLPVFPSGLDVQPEDRIRAVCSRLVEPGDFLPDYLVRGSVTRRGVAVASFEYWSRRNEMAFCSNPFHRALFAAAPAEPPRLRGMEADLVDRWRDLYDDLYRRTSDVAQPDFDVVGWNSSYDGQAIAEEAMREQVEWTANRIRELGGQRILEIGCGTGLLLLRLAEGREEYVGTDFSEQVLTGLREECDRRGLSNVRLSSGTADDLTELQDQHFDGVVLNSVVQYFPGEHYLRRVLEGAFRKLRPGGWIFVGDVRHLGFQQWLHMGVELNRMSGEESTTEFIENVQERVSREQELLLEPAWFEKWSREQQEDFAVQVEVKRGRHRNELTKFRYDVVMRRKAALRPVDGWQELSWEELGGISQLAERLARNPEALRVTRVPDARVGEEREWARRLKDARGDEPISQLLADAAEASGVEAEDLWKLERAAEYWVRVCWGEQPGEYEVLCARRHEGESRYAWGSREESSERRPGRSLVNEVLSQVTSRQREQQLKDYLKQKLPAYMVPTQYVWLESLPLTASGKLDRRKLPAPLERSTNDESAYVPPQGALQEQIAQIWSGLLGIDRISAHSSFFDLGGHSLLATQVVARLSAALGKEIPLRLLFERPTIAGFAESIEVLTPAVASPPAIIAMNHLSDADVSSLLKSMLTSDRL